MSFLLTDEPLASGRVESEVAGPDAGATVSFLGTVRGDARGRAVVRLEYEAYGPMALSQLEALGRTVSERWPGARLAVHHRLGACGVGEPTVAIAAAAPHRADAFDACRFAIEALKADVAIWKREVYADDSVWVGQGS